MLRRQFLQIVTDLRAELERSTDPAVGVSDFPTLKTKLNRVYETLYADYDWPHLMRTFDKTPLHTGERYYDPPEDLDYDRIEEVVVWWSSQPVPITRGISFQDYAFVNSEEGATQDPVEKWDVRYDSGKPTIEVWPIPASNQNSLQFRGIQKFKPLVDDADVCLLDDKMVVLFAAAEIAPAKGGNKQIFLQAANKRMLQIRGNAKSASPRVRIGGAEMRPAPRGAIIRVAR